MCVCVRVCVRACVHACVRACVCAWLCAYVCLINIVNEIQTYIHVVQGTSQSHDMGFVSNTFNHLILVLFTSLLSPSDQALVLVMVPGTSQG